MLMTWKDLITLNKRDLTGLACWLAVSVLLGSISLLAMVVREVYQWKRYNLPRFEWEDVLRYGVVITIGSIIHYWILLSILN